MLVLEHELLTDPPLTDVRGTGADRLAGGGTPRPHGHADFPGSRVRAGGR